MKRVAFFEIPVLQFDRAVRFYEQVFEVQLEVREYDTEKMGFFPEEDGKCPGALSQAKDFLPAKSGVLISLSVNDVKETLDRIRHAGGTVVREKTAIQPEVLGFFGLFTDTEGNCLGLYSEQ